MILSDLDEINVLRLDLHEKKIGYLAGFHDGRNILKFADEFRYDTGRPTFSLITHPKFPRSQELLAEPWSSRQKLHPTLSNLLPEGVLRELLTHQLMIHIDNEFHLLSHLGGDLPGALIVKPLNPDEVPTSFLRGFRRVRPIGIKRASQENKFSLAGVQMKFSMRKQDDRYSLSTGEPLGDWIIKPPSALHKYVPLNEFTAMTLASIAGVNIPEILLVEIDKLDNLPPINLPDEQLAFAIKRFDRDKNQRIHMEDFAQVLVKYPHEKYNSANYEQIARVLYRFSGEGLADIQQFARRLLINILLANGDAHLKNWSLLYPNQVTPRLSPAYDIVTTSVYIKSEKHYALNLGKTKQWYDVSYANFETWAKHADLPWRAIKPHLDDTLEKARSLWSKKLNDLPMNEQHKKHLKVHWANLQKDFKILS